MRVFVVTAGNLAREELPVENLVNLEVKIGSVVYQLSELDGQLRVSVDGQMVAKPGSANTLLLSRTEMAGPGPAKSYRK